MNSLTFGHLQSDAGLSSLLAALPHNGPLGVSVLAFEPGGCWCVDDGLGGYEKKDDGSLRTVTLDDEAIRRYWKAAAAVDHLAIAEYKKQLSADNARRAEKSFFQPDLSEGE